MNVTVFTLLPTNIQSAEIGTRDVVCLEKFEMRADMTKKRMKNNYMDLWRKEDDS